jgi:hypothetical protein
MNEEDKAISLLLSKLLGDLDQILGFGEEER